VKITNYQKNIQGRRLAVLGSILHMSNATDACDKSR